jgi:HK97 family phage portal protein
MEFREAVSVNFDLFGNAFIEIKKTPSGGVALYALESRKMNVKIENNEPVYEYQTATGTRKYRHSQIIHLRNFSIDGLTGLNPIQQQRQAIGTASAQQTFSAKMYRNGGRPSGVLEHPGFLSLDAVGNIRSDWEKVHSGADNAGKVAILWEGMKYNAIGMTADDMQFIESRKFQVAEIARIYGVPHHLLGDLERATCSNIEQQNIEFVQYVLAPYCAKWEQRLNQSLLSKEPGIYAKFNLSALMRGDAASRAHFYSSMVQNGIMSRNEVRHLEELNTIDGEADSLTVQANMLDLSDLQKITAGRGQK